MTRLPCTKTEPTRLADALREIEQLKCDIELLRGANMELRGESVRLRAEVEALRPDAERWRFWTYWNRVDPTKLPQVDEFIHESEVNEITDKAMAALRGEGE